MVAMKANKYGIRRGRHTPAKVRSKLLEEFERSGETQSVFCHARGLNAKTFGRWVKESREKREGTSVVFAEVSVSDFRPPAANVELSLPNGVLVRLPANVDVVALVERMLRSESSAC